MYLIEIQAEASVLCPPQAFSLIQSQLAASAETVGKGLRKAMPSRILTRDMATNESPEEKSFGPRSITPFFSVKP